MPPHPAPIDRPPRAPAVPEGVLVHAIGDVHGRDDLLHALLLRIAEEVERIDPVEHHVVLLGDLIDRGPRSRTVIERLIAMDWGATTLHVLRGNHEAMLLDLIDGRDTVARTWLAEGGAETLESYGVDAEQVVRATAADMAGLARAAIPDRHVAFLRATRDLLAIGDYLFVHAGIRPGVPIAAQRADDLRWIRGPFLTYQAPHPAMIVHGHSITEMPDRQNNRIGIDTGAYASGRLTALALWGTEQRFLST